MNDYDRIIDSACELLLRIVFWVGMGLLACFVVAGVIESLK